MIRQSITFVQIAYMHKIMEIVGKFNYYHRSKVSVLVKFIVAPTKTAGVYADFLDIMTVKRVF